VSHGAVLIAADFGATLVAEIALLHWIFFRKE
jgi:hypothetical protein